MEFQDSQAMRSNLLVTLFKQAIKTFAPGNAAEAEFSSNFFHLKSILDNIKSADVQLDPNYNHISTWETPNKAPCTYIEIFENQNFNMSIFVLRPGFKMPLHDHPQMHGLLKVILGAVKIKSYNKIPYEEGIRLPRRRKPFLAEITSYKICDVESESCPLTPNNCNFHEIESINGPSAFLDVLAPPYSSHEDNKARECHYYKITQEINAKVVQLEEIPPPSTFYCDQAPYLGPVLI